MFCMRTIVPTVSEFSRRGKLSDKDCFKDDENRFLEAVFTYNQYLNQTIKGLADCKFFSNMRSRLKLETTHSTRLQRKYTSWYLSVKVLKYCPLQETQN